MVWGDWQLATRGSKSGVGRGEEMGADAVAIAEPGRRVGLYEAKETVAIKVDNNTSEFPKRLAPDKLVNVITIDNIRFKILLDRIGRFSSTDTGRQQLTGALLKKI